MKPELKLIKGKVKKQQRWFKKKQLNRLLLVLGAVILVQMILGWVWNRYSYSVIETTRAETGFMENYLDIYGIVSLEEKVLLAPRSGFMHPLVEEGKRVPVGKELAFISSEPGENIHESEEERFWESLPIVGSYFSSETEEESAPQGAMFPYDEYLLAQEAGVVSYQIDGLEEYGPYNFPYLAEEDIGDFFEDEQDEIALDYSKERVSRGTPLLKIIDNYKWYFSVVVNEEKGAVLSETPRLGIYFQFAPEKRVQGRLIEEYKDGSQYHLTWEITRELPDFYLQRGTRAKISYARQEGIILPSRAIIEREDKEGIFLLEAGTARFHEVDIIKTDGDNALVEGVNHNSQVIVNPDAVRDGMMAR